jgi:hypothetical protein
VPAAPLRAILLPRIARTKQSRVARVDVTEARRALVPGSLLEGGTAGAAGLGVLTQLVARVPCYRLDLGSDLHEVAATVRNVLDAA